MITDDEARKMYVCAPLLGEPASEVVRSLVNELLAARKVVEGLRGLRRYETDEKYIGNGDYVCELIASPEGEVVLVDDVSKLLADYDKAVGG